LTYETIMVDTFYRKRLISTTKYKKNVQHRKRFHPEMRIFWMKMFILFPVRHKAPAWPFKRS
jgi:hypothetical protein